MSNIPWTSRQRDRLDQVERINEHCSIFTEHDVLACVCLGIGSRAASKVTFRDSDGKQQTRSSAHPSEGEQRTSSYSASHKNQLHGLKKKDEVNPFKFSPDTDFCALSQVDKREKAQVNDTTSNIVLIIDESSSRNVNE
jgi:hypothetical protein